jgi:hypothetical protein
MRPASESATVGSAIRLAEPVSRSRPGRWSSSTLFFLSDKQQGGLLDFIDDGAIQIANHANRVFTCRQQCQLIIQGQVCSPCLLN